MKYQVVVYESQNGNKPFEKYLEKLLFEHKTDNLAKIRSYIDNLEKYGLEMNRISKNSIKLLREKIYELRPIPTRIFFFYFDDNKFVLLHGFEKKCQKTPEEEIDKAIKEKNDYIRRSR